MANPYLPDISKTIQAYLDFSRDMAKSMQDAVDKQHTAQMAQQEQLAKLCAMILSPKDQ